jgi:hypothetical protein
VSSNDRTEIHERWSSDGMRFLGTFLVVIVAGVIAYVTFLGLVSSQVNSTSNPGNANAPVIDYGG